MSDLNNEHQSNLAIIPAQGATVAALGLTAANQISLFGCTSPCSMLFNNMGVYVNTAGPAGTLFSVGIYDGISRQLIAGLQNRNGANVGLHNAVINGNIKSGQSLIVAWSHNNATNVLRLKSVNTSAMTLLMTDSLDSRFSGEINLLGGGVLLDPLPLSSDPSISYASPIILLRLV